MFSSLPVSLPSSASRVSCRWLGCGLTQRLLRGGGLYRAVHFARKSAICCWYIYSQSHLKCSHLETSKSSCVCTCVWKMCCQCWDHWCCRVTTDAHRRRWCRLLSHEVLCWMVSLSCHHSVWHWGQPSPVWYQSLVFHLSHPETGNRTRLSHYQQPPLLERRPAPRWLWRV